MQPPPQALPSLFVPHGAPTFILKPGAAGAALAQTGAALPRPRAIIMVSAHWDSDEPLVGFAARPETLHDFWGFPQALYSLRYPATGCPAGSQAVLEALQAAGFAAGRDLQRGLDHGAWIPLSLMFPDAEIPVLPLSIQSHRDAAHHYRLGQALQGLGQQGFLVIASGNLTHNLGDYQRALMQSGQTPAYVRTFADWFARRLDEGDIEALIDYRRQAPGALQAHPQDDHLLPFFVALGAAGAAPRSQRLHAGIDDFVLAMDAFRFDAQPARSLS